jgi:16S rRNA (cytosine1402-N4)-methyltransferase
MEKYMRHISVLLKESIEALHIKDNGIYVDATFGAGGHSKEIMKRLQNGHLFAFDQDPESYLNVDGYFYGKQFTLFQSNFKDLKKHLKNQNIEGIDGILFDLGMSSMHIDDPKRGFSYMKNGPLDMRMNPNQTLTAEIVLNTYTHDQLLKVLRDYGELDKPHILANQLMKHRPYKMTFDLVKVTDLYLKNTKGHSAKQVFQALRIEVNQELEVLYQALNDAYDMLKPGGRMVVISFHSLEDTVTKKFMQSKTVHKVPKHLPIPHNQLVEAIMLTSKPITPSEEEKNINSRSKSARMRILEKVK